MVGIELIMAFYHTYEQTLFAHLPVLRGDGGGCAFFFLSFFLFREQEMFYLIWIVALWESCRELRRAVGASCSWLVDTSTASVASLQWVFAGYNPPAL